MLFFIRTQRGAIFRITSAPPSSAAFRRRMQVNSIDEVSAYLDSLRTHHGEAERWCRTCLSP